MRESGSSGYPFTTVSGNISVPNEMVDVFIRQFGTHLAANGASNLRAIEASATLTLMLSEEQLKFQLVTFSRRGALLLECWNDDDTRCIVTLLTRNGPSHWQNEGRILILTREQRGRMFDSTLMAAVLT